MAEDIQLLRHYAQTRAEDAFAALVERHVSLVYSAALRQLGGAVHRAEEVTQSVFIDLARQAPTLACRDDIVGWLYTSTHYAAAKLKRAEARRQRREQEAQMMDEISAGVSESANWEQVHPVLDEAMHELDERDRQAILLRFFKNERFADVGRRLGLSEDAARMRVERALDKLHALLAKRGITSTSAALGTALAGEAVASAPAGLTASVTTTALADAAVMVATGGVAAGVVTFMNTGKFAIGLVAIGVVGTGLGVYYARDASRAEAVVADVSRNSDQLVARLRGLRPTAGAATAAGPRDGSTVPVTAATNAARETGVATDHASLDAVIVRDLVTDPYFNELIQQKAKAEVGEGFGVFYRNLQLTPEQIAKFESALLKAKSAAWQIRVAAQLEGRAADDPATRERLRQANARLHADVQALLGESALKQFRDYDRALATQNMAEQMAARLYFSESPLSAAQVSQLTVILTHRSPQFRAGALVDAYSIEWDEVIGDAGRILAPRQLAALRGFRAELEHSRDLKAAKKVASGGK